MKLGNACSLLTLERGTEPYSYRIDGLPNGQEARVLKERRNPKWYFFHRPTNDAAMTRNSGEGFKTAEAALRALERVVHNKLHNIDA